MDLFLDIFKDNKWYRAIRAIAKFGSEGSHPVCENCGNHVDHREGAHLNKTGMEFRLKHGAGRGSNKRVGDLVKHYDEYGLFCPECHKNYDKQPQEVKDTYELPHPDKEVRGVFHDLKVKRDAREQNALQKPELSSGKKHYIRPGRAVPQGSQEQQGPRGGRYYFKMLQKWLQKEQGSEATDLIGLENSSKMEGTMDKNLYKSKDYQEADPFGAVFRKSTAVRADEPFNRGGQAIDDLLKAPINKEYEGIVKAGDDKFKAGKKVYIQPGEIAPKGTSLYRGAHGGRFYYEQEFEGMKGTSKTKTQESSMPKPSSKELSDRVKSTTEKIGKELNNLGNVGKIREVGDGKPDLPHNQGVFKQDAEQVGPKDQSSFDSGITPSTDPDRYAPSSSLNPNRELSRMSRRTKDLIDPEQHRYHSSKSLSVPKLNMAIKSLRLIKSALEKQNLPSMNPTANPMTGGGMGKPKASGVRSTLQSGFKPTTPKTEATKTTTASVPKQPTFRPPKPNIPESGMTGAQAAPKIGGVGKVTRPMGLTSKPSSVTGPSMTSRGPRTTPFAQFSLANRINKYIAKQSKK